jgi:RES domain-containing protein
MTQCWRIVKKKRAGDAFSGEGARKAPGRWNHSGSAVVYCSENLSLAALELFMRLQGHGRHLSFVHFQIDIPNDVAVEAVTADLLPAGWDFVPPMSNTKELGNTWANDQRTAVLKVPSVAIRSEFNVILNPSHPDFAKIKIHNPPQPFSFDPRMWGDNPYSQEVVK